MSNISGRILKDTQVLYTEGSNLAVTVGQFVGGGGQGEVYRAQIGDQTIALKWYYPSNATFEQREALETLVRKGAPNDRFLWPSELVSAIGMRGYGYIMPLRDPHYKSIIDLMKRRIKPEPSFRTLVTAGLELTDSFLHLHAMGLCYRDISFGNVFFDPNNGQVLICDNDNVTVDGQGSATVLGTPRFMAPEIVRGEALPSTQTDLFSLAVLLFYILMVSHPLEGKQEASIRCFDLAAMRKIYGINPVFIFDPNDDSNRPVSGIHGNALAFWPLYPKFIHNLFERAFTRGLHDPLNGRVRESEWRAAMSALRDSIMYCASCGAENFFDTSNPPGDSKQTRHCWACNHTLRLPYRIRFGSEVVVLNHDSLLYPHHLDAQSLYNFSAPTAQVTRHPQDLNIWGLKNLSNRKWVMTPPGGSARDVEPGRSARLSAGVRINFGRVEGVIEI